MCLHKTPPGCSLLMMVHQLLCICNCNYRHNLTCATASVNVPGQTTTKQGRTQYAHNVHVLLKVPCYARVPCQRYSSCLAMLLWCHSLGSCCVHPSLIGRGYRGTHGKSLLGVGRCPPYPQYPSYSSDFGLLLPTKGPPRYTGPLQS